MRLTYAAPIVPAAGSPLVTPSAAEEAIEGLSLGKGGPVTEMWAGDDRAIRGSGKTAIRWYGRFGNRILEQAGSTNAIYVASGVNSKGAIGLIYGSGMRCVGLSPPTGGDYSVAVVIQRCATSPSTRALWGTSDAAASSHRVSFTAGGVAAYRNNVVVVNSAAATAAGEKAVFVFGWKNDITRATLRRNGTQLGRNTNAQAGPSGHFMIGGYAGPSAAVNGSWIGAVNGSSSGSQTGLSIADPLVYSSVGATHDPDLIARVIYAQVDLTDAAHATALATLESNLGAIYGITIA